MVKVLVNDLEKLKGLTSDFGSTRISQVKLYKRMKTFPMIWDGLSFERLPSTFVTIFEAIVTQFLEPMARELNSNLRKKNTYHQHLH